MTETKVADKPAPEWQNLQDGVMYRGSSYDPETHEQIPNKRDLLKELKAATKEEIQMGRRFHDHTERYDRAMEAFRNG